MTAFSLRRVGYCALMALAISVAATARGADPDASQQKLRDLPITLYPEVDVSGSSLPEFMNVHARPDDAVVLSWTDALKGSFRVSQLGISSGQVWLYISKNLDLAQRNWRNMPGISGIVFEPERGTTLMPSIVDEVAKTAADLHCTFVVGVEGQRTEPLFDVSTLSRPAQVITIYDGPRLALGAGAYRDYVTRMIREARTTNPAIKIEVAVATGGNEAATKANYETLLACSDLADRIGIFCDDTRESRQSLAQFFTLLRGPTQETR